MFAIIIAIVEKLGMSGFSLWLQSRKPAPEPTAEDLNKTVGADEVKLQTQGQTNEEVAKVAQAGAKADVAAASDPDALLLDGPGNLDAKAGAGSNGG